VLSATATGRTTHLLAEHAPPLEALSAGFQRALFACSISLAAAALLALRTTNARGEIAHEEAAPAGPVAVPEAA
jgi:hypothetical protein